MKKFLSTIGILLSLLTPIEAFGATSYYVNADEPMSLKNGITSSQTSSILFTGGVRNNVRQTFATQSGGILELSYPNREYVELIYYSSATVDQTSATKDVTLSGVVRGLLPNNSNELTMFAQGETGRTWARGTKATLVDAPQLWNSTAKKDLRNNYRGSGSTVCMNANQPCINVGRWTTAQVAALKNFTGGSLFFNITTNQLGYSDGTNKLYLATNSGSTANIGYGNRGEAQLPTPTQVFNQTGTGSSGAGLVVAVKDVVHNSGSTIAAGAVSYVVATSGSTIDKSLIAVSPGSGDLLQVMANGDVEGRSTTQLGISTGFKHEATITTSSAAFGAGTTASGTIKPVYTGTGVDANALKVGSVIHVNMGGSTRQAAGSTNMRIFAGGKEILNFEFNFLGFSTSSWSLNADIVVRTIGANGSLFGNGVLAIADPEPASAREWTSTGKGHAQNSAATVVTGIDTTQAVHVILEGHFETANGSNQITLDTGSITVTSP